MSDQPIYFIRSGEGVVLHPTPYKTEDVFQELLARYPEVLAGGNTAGDGNSQLLLVQREMKIPTEYGGSAVFSLDHLFLDAQAIPVIVEVKRSSDTRIRREVAAQMLDYAANATRYWSLPALRKSVGELAAEAAGQTMSEADQLGDLAVSNLIGADEDVEDFWTQVEANLRQGRVRMVFVADHIPDTLRRIIEFLNEQMDPAEVLGVEVVQYLSDDGLQVLVPRLVGATSAARQTKSSRNGGQQWDRESFLDVATERTSQEVVTFFTLLLDLNEKSGGRLS